MQSAEEKRREAMPEQRSEIARKTGQAGGRGRKKGGAE